MAAADSAARHSATRQVAPQRHSAERSAQRNNLPAHLQLQLWIRQRDGRHRQRRAAAAGRVSRAVQQLHQGRRKLGREDQVLGCPLVSLLLAALLIAALLFSIVFPILPFTAAAAAVVGRGMLALARRRRRDARRRCQRCSVLCGEQSRRGRIPVRSPP